jgi:TetR/AcrR family transcriptional regulator, regulator of mycofactocin system
MSDPQKLGSTAQSLAERMRAERSEMMASGLEAISLRLFEARGFEKVTVEEIASEAAISVRTFYRYFPSKADVFQRQIERRSEGLRAALAARPLDEPPLHSLRQALTEQIAGEEPELLRRWMVVIQATPSVIREVLGGIQLHTQRVIAEFVGERLSLPSDALVPRALAGAVQGVIQAAQVQWHLHGGDLATTLSESLGVLEHG